MFRNENKFLAYRLFVLLRNESLKLQIIKIDEKKIDDQEKREI